MLKTLQKKQLANVFSMTMNSVLYTGAQLLNGPRCYHHVRNNHINIERICTWNWETWLAAPRPQKFYKTCF